MTPAHLQYLLLAQYITLCCWHALRQSWVQSMYWLGAGLIVASVTLGMGKP